MTGPRSFLAGPLPNLTILFPALFLGAFLLCFLILPVGQLVINALSDEGALTFDALAIFAANPLYAESLSSSLGTALGAALMAAAAALPVAWLLWRFEQRLSPTLALLGVIPLFIPPFMLSLSLQSLLGRGGGIGLLAAGHIDLDPSQWGLAGLMLIEAAHYYPLVLTVVVLGTSPLSREAGESARLGTSWFRLTSRVFLPLGLPALVFGMAITFLKTLDDLATPLSLGITNLIAPQAYFRVTTYGAQDLLSSVMALAMVATSMFAWGLSATIMRQSDTYWQASPIPGAQRGRQPGKTIGRIVLSALIVFYSFGYSGMLLTALSGIWSHTPLPETFGLMHFSAALKTEAASFLNTLFYCGIAATIDVAVGAVMAYTILSAPVGWGKHLNWSIAALLGVPGAALAIAYLQFFNGMTLPLIGRSLDAIGFLLPTAFAIRGLPFAIPACTFALRGLPGSHLEAAAMSGASRFAIARRIVLPSLVFGLSVAFLICFGIAAVDLSAAMLLVPSETEAPTAYTIYLNMQTSTGRGTGSALAVLAVGVVALATGVLAGFLGRRDTTTSLGHAIFRKRLN